MLSSSKKRPSASVDFAIDGAIFALFPDGTIDVYHKGEYIKTISYAVEPPLVSPDKIFTDDRQSYIWILERKNSRIIVLTKEGVFIKQLHFPNIPDIKDIFVAQDNTLYLLASDKIYSYMVALE